MTGLGDGIQQKQAELTGAGLEQWHENLGVPTGRDLKAMIEENQARIMRLLGADRGKWQDWRWQFKHRVKDPETLSRVLPLKARDLDMIRQLSTRFRWAVTPYYLSLIDGEHYDEDPIFRQAIPSAQELDFSRGSLDPMLEREHTPVAGVTRRYPDRLIINVTSRCATYCRHCQRRRNVIDGENELTRDELVAALAYIKEHREIRDVLLTGGDALLISPERLAFLLRELDRLPNVEIKRIGTRVPVTLPQGITNQLVDILKAYPPVYLNTQFNHPREITEEAAQACARLAEAGVVLGNQSVLLKGINDDLPVMRRLNQQLLTLRVRPYYLFQAKEVTGTTHFVTSFDRGIEIMRGLRGFTSGLANPLYIVNAPGGQGKIPLVPEYYLGSGDGYVYFRTWQQHVVSYPVFTEPGTTEAPDE